MCIKVHLCVAARTALLRSGAAVLRSAAGALTLRAAKHAPARRTAAKLSSRSPAPKHICSSCSCGPAPPGGSAMAAGAVRRGVARGQITPDRCKRVCGP